jgi:hypothetical protein
MPGYYAEEYGSGFFASFEGMMQAIIIVSVIFVVIGVLLLLMSIKLEAKRE